jgi:hypothetical protein
MRCKAHNKDMGANAVSSAATALMNGDWLRQPMGAET